MPGRPGGVSEMLEVPAGFKPPDAAAAREAATGFVEAAALGGAAIGPLGGEVRLVPEVRRPADRSVSDQDFTFDNNDALPPVSAAARAERDKRDEASAAKDYLNKIGKTPLLTAEQEVHLAKRIEAGLYARHILEDVPARAPKSLSASPAELEQVALEGEAAKDRFVAANLRLVVSIAKRYVGRGMPFTDMIQEGNLGLIHAVEKFDYAQGFKFSTYATWWIRQHIVRAMATQRGAVTLPVHLAEDIQKVVRARDALTNESGREPTARELAAGLGMTQEGVEKLLIYNQEPVSLDAPPAGGNDDRPFMDLLEAAHGAPAADNIDHALLREELAQEISKALPQRDGLMVMLRFGLYDGKEYTLQEIAVLFDRSAERVRQIIKHSLEVLKDNENFRGQYYA